MLPLVWSHQAQSDLLSIITYIGERNPIAAERLADAIRASVWPLQEHPELFRKSERVPGCREIVVHPNYILVYRVEPASVRVLRILHARQQYP